MSVAIRVENLSKKYVLRHQVKGRSRYVSLRDVLANQAASLFRRQQGSNPAREDFWALRGLSFDVNSGEAIGVIGRNGAGKSTLLKLLSRITKPTEGRIEIHGRVASLLEVGTGFHPELTGRENIYLNGAIMGMKRQEIRQRFDEIVAFADVEKFLDTPVKHFSSGMYVRLAFAVAAHLEPEILVVDEVLAVGDLQFQKKCLTKMEDVTGRQGRTVLFVSHNMDLITKLCSKAILLSGGTVVASGPVDAIARKYMEQANVTRLTFKAKAPRPLRFAMIDQEALLTQKLVVKIGFSFERPAVHPVFGIVLYTEGGSPITGTNSIYHPPSSQPSNLAEGEATATIDYVPLWSGRYNVSIWLSDALMPLDHEVDALTFEIVANGTPLNAPDPKVIGPVYLPAHWKVQS